MVNVNTHSYMIFHFLRLFSSSAACTGGQRAFRHTQGLVFSRNQEGLGKMYDAMWKCWHKQLIGSIQWENFRKEYCCGISYENGPVS
jgi:hypothetical protein